MELAADQSCQTPPNLPNRHSFVSFFTQKNAMHFNLHNISVRNFAATHPHVLLLLLLSAGDNSTGRLPSLCLMTLGRDVLPLCPFKNHQPHNCLSHVSRHHRVCVCCLTPRARVLHSFRRRTSLMESRIITFCVSTKASLKKLFLFPKLESFKSLLFLSLSSTCCCRDSDLFKGQILNFILLVFGSGHVCFQSENRLHGEMCLLLLLLFLQVSENVHKNTF